MSSDGKILVLVSVLFTKHSDNLVSKSIKLNGEKMEFYIGFLVISALICVGFAVFAISQNGHEKPSPDHERMRNFHAQSYSEREEHKKHCNFEETGKHCAFGTY